jgi:hypothetical protein
VTTKGVQSAAAEPALDAIAVAFEARLVALDREAAGPNLGTSYTAKKTAGMKGPDGPNVDDTC